jgi:hypothetical protein
VALGQVAVKRPAPGGREGHGSPDPGGGAAVAGLDLAVPRGDAGRFQRGNGNADLAIDEVVPEGLVQCGLFTPCLPSWRVLLGVGATFRSGSFVL